MAHLFRTSFRIAAYKRNLNSDPIRQPESAQDGKTCHKCRQRSNEGSFVNINNGKHRRWICNSCDSRAINKLLEILKCK